VKYAAGIVGRDDVIAAGAHLSLGRVDRLVAERLRDQSDLSAMLDVDQSVLMHDSAVPKRIRSEEVRGRKERPILADNAETIPGGKTRNAQKRPVVVRCARDRHQAAGSPDLFGLVFEAECGEEQNFNRDLDVRLDDQAIAIHPEYNAVLTDRGAVVQGTKA
jgi:hypothetical protein